MTPDQRKDLLEYLFKNSLKEYACLMETIRLYCEEALVGKNHDYYVWERSRVERRSEYYLKKYADDKQSNWELTLMRLFCNDLYKGAGKSAIFFTDNAIAQEFDGIKEPLQYIG